MHLCSQLWITNFERKNNLSDRVNTIYIHHFEKEPSSNLLTIDNLNAYLNIYLQSTLFHVYLLSMISPPNPRLFHVRIVHFLISLNATPSLPPSDRRKWRINRYFLSFSYDASPIEGTSSTFCLQQTLINTGTTPSEATSFFSSSVHSFFSSN